MTGTSLYVHVPFCVVKCGYCDFNSYVPDGTDALDRFLQMLDRELTLHTLPDAFVSIFIGGGTPTFLDEPRFARLFEVLARHVDLRSPTEITCEANPESVTAEKASIAREAGVNRISIGAQSFDPARLRFLDRAHDGEKTEQAFARFRDAGFENISLDLMFGIPEQTNAQWEQDLSRALALRPDHLSCYNLTFEPGTRLHRDRAQGKVAENDDRIDLQMFEHTRERLAKAGYHAYEISNFAGRGGPCRHNDHYWLQGDYVGVGPGASSHRAGVRSTNLKPLEAWGRSIALSIPPVATAETLTPRQRAAEALWLGLRRTEGVDLAEIGARTAMDLEKQFVRPIEAHLKAGFLTLDRTRLALTKAGLIHADGVGSSFLID